MSKPITRQEALLNSIANGENSQIQPITREEQYLSYIAGESYSYPPNPITRKEAYLDKIARSGVSGGSGVNVQSLTVTENGTYTAPQGVAYSPVNVQVQSQGGSSGGENKLAKLIGRTIEEITVEDLAGTTNMGEYAFYRCYRLRSVTIRNGITSIDYHAFSGCEQLTSVAIPNSVMSIKGYAFANCTKLPSITIPNKVSGIAYNAFYNCKKLASITFEENSTLTLFGDRAFYNCWELTSITVPSSVSTIASLAFEDCKNLTKVKLLATTPPTVSSNAFSGVPDTCIYEVPASAYEAYASATNWSALNLVPSEEF